MLSWTYIQKQSFLSLLFCNSVQSNLDQSFHDFCEKDKINVYKIVPLTTAHSYSFRVEPLHVCASRGLPEMICVIFETRLINNIIVVDNPDEEENFTAEDEKEYLN